MEYLSIKKKNDVIKRIMGKIKLSFEKGTDYNNTISTKDIEKYKKELSAESLEILKSSIIIRIKINDHLQALENILFEFNKKYNYKRLKKDKVLRYDVFKSKTGNQIRCEGTAIKISKNSRRAYNDIPNDVVEKIHELGMTFIDDKTPKINNEEIIKNENKILKYV